MGRGRGSDRTAMDRGCPVEPPLTCSAIINQGSRARAAAIFCREWPRLRPTAHITSTTYHKHNSGAVAPAQGPRYTPAS
eukprot:scaffold7006_cov108-Isochrysis_galbana.AAC.9